MNDNPTITVILRTHRFDPGTAVTLEVGIHQAYQLLAPIDFPDADPGLAVLFCTPDAQRKLLERHEIIAVISKAAARALADMIGAKDTVMGYPKERK